MDEMNPDKGTQGPIGAQAPAPAEPVPTATPGVVEEPISAVAALAGVYFSPSQTFRKLVERPWWFALVPIVILSVLGVISSYLFVSRVDMKEFVRDQIRQNKFASQQMSEDQIDEAAEKAAQRPKWIQPVIGGFALVIIVLILAAIFWLVLLAFGESPGFSKSFQVTAWAFLPSLLAYLIFIVLLFIKNANEMNIDNPMFTNPAAFFDKESIAKPLYALLMAFDLFKAWIIVLLSIGLAAAAKCKVSKSATVVVVLYAVWVLIKIGLAAIF